MISIQSNMEALYASRQFQINKKDSTKSAEKLSSGYRINRAADDAAGLAISERMRRRIRGLAQGTKNGQDGVSWVQTGDGALNEADEILHRMTELTVKALNGTNSDGDRAVMEEELEHLKLELDRIGTTTTFNEMDIFSEHESPYYQCDGGAKWDVNQIHVISAGQNEITFEYRKNESDPPSKASFPVPPGEYTTMELLDELEEVMAQGNGDGTKFVMKCAEGGFVNASLEGGERIDSVTGGLSYLLYDTYKGGSTGMLIGTTIFPNDTTRLLITANKNDKMTFSIQNFDGSGQPKPMEITIPPGYHTRGDLIDIINSQLKNTTVKASPYGTGIKLGSDSAVVTGFKGNMFTIDGSKYTSVFYDNVKHGEVQKTSALFQGGYVLTQDKRDAEHGKFVIDSTNNTLTLQPNGMDTGIDLIIKDGEYTVDEMCTELNKLFQVNNLDLKADKLDPAQTVVLDQAVTFDGIQISSGVEGLDSKINPDKNSSAYNTLFVAREYNRYGSRAVLANETEPDVDAWFWGGKNLSGITPTSTMELTANNNKFEITINDTDSGSVTRTITIPARVYASANEVIAKITEELESYIDTKDKVTVSLENGRIKMVGKPGKSIDSIQVNPDNSSSYDMLFKGTTVRVLPTTNSSTGSITLDTPGKLNSTSMVIKVDNTPYTVTFPPDASKADIADAIKTQIPASETGYLNWFSNASGYGSSSDKNFSSAGSGSESVTSWSASAQGTSTGKEGVAGFETSTPAILTVEPQLRDKMTIDSGNSQLMLTLNGQTKLLTLTEGTYDQEGLKNEIQAKIDLPPEQGGFGNDWGGAEVKVVDNQLVLTSRLPDGYDGKDSSISCGTGSSFLRYLNTTEKPAMWISNLALDSNIKLTGNNNVFTFTYEENGKTQKIDLPLASGDYTPDSLVTQMNICLNRTGTGIRAALSNGRLQLTSAACGSDVSIRYSTLSGGNSAGTLFGELTGASPARAVVDMKLQDSVEIEAGKQNFRIFINNQPQNIELREGTYGRDGFVRMVNECMKEQGVAAEAYLSAGKIGFVTMAKGDGVSIGVSYDDSAGSAMAAVYGKTTVVTPGVDAAWNGDKLTLRAVDTHGNTMQNRVTVASDTGGGLQPPDIVTSYTYPTGDTGYHSRKCSNVDGVNLSGDVTIDKWNNDLSFTFYDNGSSRTVNLTLQDGPHSYDALKTELQTAIDGQVGAGKINVTVDGSGVKLQAAGMGSKYRFGGMSGGFYWKVMCACTETDVPQQEKNTDGTQKVTQAYTIGRKDVKNQVSEINRGISDELSIDLSYNDVHYTIEVTLDPGRYQGETLRQHVQDKLDAWFEARGLKKGVIEVGIGGISSGVQGGCDNEALNFRLAADVASPGKGETVIDGVSGNAAFEIFYQTDGKLVPAYIIGTKDITAGVTVEPDETELAFDVDGTIYKVDLDEGDYAASELIDAVNEKFKAGKVPLVASVDFDTGRMKISYNQVGSHEIREVSGGAKNDVFFAEHGGRDDTARYVQLSEARGDRVELPRSEFGTAMLGIHSVCITRIKYAEKTLERLEKSLGKVSALRSNFGSTQNRLEHAIRNNENSEENMQAAESVIRDTDMAGQMVRYANQNILLQAGQSILAQANKNRQFILGLLS